MTDSLNNDCQQAEEVLVRLLARREHSALELRQKLQQRGFDHEIIEKVLTKAEQQGWQSDARYLDMWLRNCLARGDGIQKIRAVAYQKGIQTEMLEQLIAELQPNWAAHCYDRLVRRFGQQPPRDQKELNRMMRYLMQRGYRLDQIKQALEQQRIAASD